MTTLSQPSLAPEIDLCEFILQRMHQAGFAPQNVQKFISNSHFQSAIGKPPYVQRGYLVAAVNHIFVSASEQVPTTIRLAAISSVDPVAWVDDIQTIVLPFFKENESFFFDNL